MRGRRRRDLARNAAQPLLNELLERPACAVARQHAQIVQVDVRVAVRLRDFLVVDLRQPVVRRDRARVGKDQPAHRVGDGRILLHAPVGGLDVAVDQLLVVQNGRLHIADLLPLLAVKDIALGDVGVAGLLQHRFHRVLNVLDVNKPVLDLLLVVGRRAQREQIDDALRVLPVLRLECLRDRRADFGQVEIHNLAVSFYNLIHWVFSPSSF